MFKFIRRLFLTIIAVIALFFLHIPVLKLITTPWLNAGRANAPAFADGLTGDTYKITRILNGGPREIQYNPRTEQYIIIADLIDTDTRRATGRHAITLDSSGATLATERVSMDEVDALLSNQALERVRRTPSTMYPPQYTFDALQGQVKLTHFQFQEFADWPGMVYMFPMVFFDWRGTAFLEITHKGEVFNTRIPTNYFGGFLYSIRNVDGQIYMFTHDGTPDGLTFLEVGESSSTRGMNGVETHRDGFGLYVITPK